MRKGLLIPDAYFESVRDLDPERLRGEGCRGLILDLDNTLVGWNVPEPTPELLDWLGRLAASGCRLCVLSNNTEERVRSFCDRAGIPGIARAVKPRRGAYRAALRQLGTAPWETWVVGDQLFTDVFGAKRLGLRAVLVRPLARREFLGTRLVRLAERLWLRRLRRAGLLP